MCITYFLHNTCSRCQRLFITTAYDCNLHPQDRNYHFCRRNAHQLASPGSREHLCDACAETRAGKAPMTASSAATSRSGSPAEVEIVDVPMRDIFVEEYLIELAAVAAQQGKGCIVPEPMDVDVDVDQMQVDINM